ncbi:hypothetical protein MBANPS3_004781 [Mucor bainieri]
MPKSIHRHSHQSITDKLATPSNAYRHLAQSCIGMVGRADIEAPKSNSILHEFTLSFHENLISSSAMVNKYEKYVDQLKINMEKCQEGRGTWYELCFAYNKLEIIATGGLHNIEQKNDGIGAFLGVAAPPYMAQDTNFLLFHPEEPAAATSCPRMLRNYTKKGSMFKRCFKATYFEEIGFSTPSFLKLSKHRKLLKKLIKAEYYKDIGFNTAPSANQAVKRVKIIQAGKSSKRKPSVGKLQLIKLILEKYSSNHDERLVMSMYNSIIAPRVKMINQKRVKELVTRLSVE